MGLSLWICMYCVMCMVLYVRTYGTFCNVCIPGGAVHGVMPEEPLIMAAPEELLPTLGGS